MTAKSTASIAIMSGKGGVGKTNISLNLACALQSSGQQCLLMDCDMGLANTDILLGITPEKTLEHVFRGECSVPEILYPVIAQRGLDLLPAASGLGVIRHMSEDNRELLLQHLTPLFPHYDYFLMDLGAGITQTVQTFAAMAAMRILVITPEPTSLTDGYALIKVLLTRFQVRDFLILVNLAHTPEEAQTAYTSLAEACRRFLNIDPPFLGHILQDPAVIKSVQKQRPFVHHAPECRASKNILQISKKVERIRRSMEDWLASHPVLQPLPPINS